MAPPDRNVHIGSVCVSYDDTGLTPVMRNLMPQAVQCPKRRFLFGRSVIGKVDPNLIKEAFSVFQIEIVHRHFHRTEKPMICSGAAALSLVG